MEMDQLRYFAKAAELGHFTHAAEACAVSQPALTQAIQKLEKEFGKPLFERIGRKALLTEAGKTLQRRALELLAMADDARREMEEEPDAGALSIGVIPTIAPFFLPRVLPAFLKAKPKCRMEVVEGVTEVLFKRCAAAELDLVIAALPVRDPVLRADAFHAEELFLVVPPRHRLAKRVGLRLADLREESFITLQEAHCLSDTVEGYCRRGADSPILLKQASQLQTVMELVAAGQGVSLVPEMALPAAKRLKLAMPELEKPRPKRTLAFVRHRMRFQRALTGAFMQTAKAAVATSPPASSRKTWR